jgi:hypothetical protein
MGIEEHIATYVISDPHCFSHVYDNFAISYEAIPRFSAYMTKFGSDVCYGSYLVKALKTSDSELSNGLWLKLIIKFVMVML